MTPYVTPRGGEETDPPRDAGAGVGGGPRGPETADGSAHRPQVRIERRDLRAAAVVLGVDPPWPVGLNVSVPTDPLPVGHAVDVIAQGLLSALPVRLAG